MNQENKNVSDRSFMEALGSLPADATEKIEELEILAMCHYIEMLNDEFIEKTHPKDGVFVINAMRLLLSGIRQKEPEMYDKALEMLPEEEMKGMVEVALFLGGDPIEDGRFRGNETV